MALNSGIEYIYRSVVGRVSCWRSGQEIKLVAWFILIAATAFVIFQIVRLAIEWWQLPRPRTRLFIVKLYREGTPWMRHQIVDVKPEELEVFLQHFQGYIFKVEKCDRDWIEREWPDIYPCQFIQKWLKSIPQVGDTKMVFLEVDDDFLEEVS